jgi:putative membrane protein
MKSQIKSSSHGCVLKRSIIATAAALAALALQAENAEDTTPKTEGRTARGQGAVVQEQLTATSFIKEAMQGNLAEIALADVATQKSQNAEVKQFAEHVRKDHTEANQKLQAIAQKNSIATDQELNAKHKAKQTEFEQKSGEEFDKEFAKCMLKDHAKTIGKYEQAAKLQDADVRKYAQDTLPKLRQHLTHAKDVAKTVGVDETTISSLTAGTSEAAGGTGDSAEIERGAAKKPADADKEAQPK